VRDSHQADTAAISSTLDVGLTAALGAVARSAGAEVEAFLRKDPLALARALRAATDRSGFGPARRLDRHLRAVVGADPSDQARRAAIAGLMLGLATEPPPTALPPSIEALYPAAREKLASYLADSPAYEPECYAKDARFVAGMSVCAGAQAADVLFQAGPLADLRRWSHLMAMTGRLLLMGDFAGAAKLVRARGWKPWLEIHTDQRSLEDFNEAGWDACYARIAAIVRLRPDVAGFWGASWFYDPQLPAISPRLAYLQTRPLAHGAVMVRLSASRLDAERAMQTSATRRALIVSGRYRPVCYAMFWPRQDLLAWAGRRADGLDACLATKAIHQG
jgi:hypothetical protein